MDLNDYLKHEEEKKMEQLLSEKDDNDPLQKTPIFDLKLEFEDRLIDIELSLN